jgi:uncharacterized protein
MMEGEKMCILAERFRNSFIKDNHAEKFSCETLDHMTLNGLYVERTNPKGTLVLCHGYQCCKELTIGYAEMFPDYNAVLFDFRAHGENKKSITTIGCHEYKDVAAVVEWLKKNKPNCQNMPLVILGVSMGGAAALKATANDPTLCDALIIDSSFSDLKSVLYNTFAAKSGLPSFPFLPIMEKMFNYFGCCEVATMRPLDSVKKIDKPLMLIHACVDDTVPVQESLLIYAQVAKTGAKLWIAPECKHGWLHKKYPELYKKKIEKFLAKQVLTKQVLTKLVFNKTNFTASYDTTGFSTTS